MRCKSVKANQFKIICPSCKKSIMRLSVHDQTETGLGIFPDGYNYAIVVSCLRDGCGRCMVVGYLKQLEDFLLDEDHPFESAVSQTRVLLGHCSKPIRTPLPTGKSLLPR